MRKKYSAKVGVKTYLVDVSELNGKWTAGVVPVFGPPGYQPLWTCEAPSEEKLKEKLDAHFRGIGIQVTSKI